MKKIVLISTLLIGIISSTSYADTLAKCSNPQGHAYYAYQGIISEDNSGWKEDQISPGLIELQKIDNNFDVTYIDAQKKMSSTIQDDKAKVSLLNQSENEISLLVNYPSGGVDIYRFFRENNGNQKLAILSMRTQIHKNSVMIGDCSFIKFK